jgi:hypothetical protein
VCLIGARHSWVSIPLGGLVFEPCHNRIAGSYFPGAFEQVIPFASLIGQRCRRIPTAPSNVAFPAPLLLPDQIAETESLALGPDGEAMSDIDAIIIGAGHNGLTCAAYLGMAGLRVRVFERRAMVGGACVMEEFHPGFRNSTAAYTVSLLQPKVICDLKLYEHGLRVVERRSGGHNAAQAVITDLLRD